MSPRDGAGVVAPIEVTIWRLGAGAGAGGGDAPNDGPLLEVAAVTTGALITGTLIDESGTAGGATRELVVAGTRLRAGIGPLSAAASCAGIAPESPT